MVYQESEALNRTNTCCNEHLQVQLFGQRIYCVAHYSSQGHNNKGVYNEEAGKMEEQRVLFGWFCFFF